MAFRGRTVASYHGLLTGSRAISVRGSVSLIRIVLLVSCAHALVHILEQSIGSVEQAISSEYSLSRSQSGWMGMALRWPYGFGALLAGLLADRLGSRRVLGIYLGGAAAVCLSMLLSHTAALVYGQLFLLGSFASMYHPAGLGLIANSTTLQERSRALGWHGVLGSAGIATAPFLAGTLIYLPGVDWRGYYAFLGIICGLLAVVVTTQLRGIPDHTASAPKTADLTVDVTKLQVRPFAMLTSAAACSGVVYAAFLHFLMRDLLSVQVPGLPPPTSGSVEAWQDSVARYLSAIVLACGAFGQWLAGRIARHDRLAPLLATIFILNAPLLLWFAAADGLQRLLAACVFAFVHFMNQPVYNSLLPEFVPRNRRSTWFGFSNMMGFGIGSAGPPLLGAFGSSRSGYLLLAGLAVTASLIMLCLWRYQLRTNARESRGG